MELDGGPPSLKEQSQQFNPSSQDFKHALQASAPAEME